MSDYEVRRLVEPDELRDRLDRALVAAEAAKREQHKANGRAQKLLGVAEAAVKTLDRVGLLVEASRLEALIKAAMEGA